MNAFQSSVAVATLVLLSSVVCDEAQSQSSSPTQTVCETTVNGIPPDFDVMYFIGDGRDTLLDAFYQVENTEAKLIELPPIFSDLQRRRSPVISPTGDLFLFAPFYLDNSLIVWHPETSETTEYRFFEPYDTFNFDTAETEDDFNNRRIRWIDETTIQINIFDPVRGNQLLRTLEFEVGLSPLSLSLTHDISYSYPDPLPYPEYETDLFMLSAEASFSPTGRYLTLGDYATNPEDGYFRLLEAQTLNVLLDVRADDQRQYRIPIWSPHDEYAAVFSVGGFGTLDIPTQLMLVTIGDEQATYTTFDSQQLLQRMEANFSRTIGHWSSDSHYFAFYIDFDHPLGVADTPRYVAILNVETGYITASCLPLEFEFGQNFTTIWFSDNRFFGLFSRSGFYVLERDMGVIYQLPDILDVFPNNSIYFAGWIPNEASDEE